MTNVKRALVLGALAGQVDAIAALRARGIETHACGHERKGPGVDAADGFHLADITDPAAVQRLAEELDVDLVYSVGSDIAMPTVVAVSEALGLPHFHGAELTRVLRRKEEIRRVLDNAGLSPVRYAHVGSGERAAWEVFPCIVKPVDAQGQRGITVVQAAAELPAAVATAQAASTSDDAIIEEYLIGREVSAHVIVEGGVAALVIPTDRYVWEGPLTGVPEAHSMPLRPETASAEAAIHELIDAVVVALGVQDGPLYVQMMVTSAGPRVIEIASRLDGCHLWRMIRESTGYDLLDDVLGRLCGEAWRAPRELEAAPTTLRFILDTPGTRATQAYRAEHRSPDATFVEWQLEPGDLPRETNPIVARLGYEIVPGVPW